MNEHDDNISFHCCVNFNVLNYCVLSVGKALFKMVKLEHESVEGVGRQIMINSLTMKGNR